MIKNNQRKNVYIWECKKCSHKKEKHVSEYCYARMVTFMTIEKYVIRGKFLYIIMRQRQTI